MDGDHTSGPVDGDELAGVQSLCGVAGADDSGNAVLAGYQGGVRGQGAAGGDHGGGPREQWSPGRGGGLGDQDVPVGEAGEVRGVEHEVDRTGGAAGGRRMPEERTGGNRAGAAGLLDGAVDHVADQSGRPAERQRRGQPTLPLPQLPPAANVAHPVGPTGDRGAQLVVGAEVDVVRHFDCPDGGQVFAQASHARPQHRPGHGELGGLFLAGDRVPLADPHQPVDFGQQPRPVGQGLSAPALGVAALAGEVAVPVSAVPIFRAGDRGELTGDRVIPVDALHRIGRRYRGGQAAQQHLGSTCGVG